MFEGFVGVLLFLAVFAFWSFILYIFWHILQALRSIDKSVDDLAKTFRNQKSKLAGRSCRMPGSRPCD